MGFKPEWANLFKDIPNVVIAFDRDQAGMKGTRKVVEAFETIGRVAISMIDWPEGIKDANEFIMNTAANTTGDCL
jgi:DNA primase